MHARLSTYDGQADEMRSSATQPSGAQIQSVEHFEITTTAGDA